MKKQILDKKIIHGRPLCNYVFNYYKHKLPEAKVSDNITILTVVNRSSRGQNFLKNSNIKNNKIIFIEVEKYIKWTSKIAEIIKYVENNYEQLGDYILYLDAFDAAIINDILNPKEILEYYNCKILFNCEPDFWHTGAEAPNGIKGYYDLLYKDVRDSYIKKNELKFNIPFNIAKSSLNAGVFLGEKDFTLKVLKETLNYMTANSNLKFPYGCMDDQCVLKFMNDKYHKHICIDIFRNTMIWGTQETLKNNDSPFNPEFYKEYVKNYNDVKEDDLNVIITTSPSPFHPDTKFIDEVIDSLSLINLPKKHKIIIAMDGLKDGGHLEKYKQYRFNIKKKYGNKENFILSAIVTKQNGLTGNIRHALNHATSENVLIIQHDLPFTREFDIQKVLEDFKNNEDIKHLRFNKRDNNEEGCDEVTKGLSLNLFGVKIIGDHYTYISTPCWSDNNHLTTLTYYNDIILNECRDSESMELIIFPKLTNDVYNKNDEKITLNAHKKYGTYLFDDIGSKPYIKHTDAYPKR